MMNEITFLLIERSGLLLLAAFLLSRLPSFKDLLDRELGWKTSLSYSIIFGLFSIFGTLAGVHLVDGEILKEHRFVFAQQSTGLVHAGIVGIMMAGLLGGPVVGVGAGMIAGIHFYFFGGLASLAYAIASPFIGIFAGLSARFFSAERIISPAKSLFISMFGSIIFICSILIFTWPAETAIELVNIIGIPMVLTNSLAVAILTTMVRLALNEKEQAQALQTEKALKIAKRVLPFLKQGLNYETARLTAQLLLNELQPSAVAVTDTRHILAHIGTGSDHHVNGTRLMTKSATMALISGQVQVITKQGQIGCSHPNCSLKAAILVPFSQSGRVAGLIKFYYKRPQQIRSVDIALAHGLGQLISNQLTIAQAEKMSQLIKDAELRTLQAQINPHFLFNTLNTIVSLIRINPQVARQVTLQLANFIRHNLKALTNPLIPLTDEINQLNSYLQIIDVRFSEQLNIELEVSPELREALIPPTTIQPLVENSIQHGLKHKSSGGVIRILVLQEESDVLISIEDNGSGIPEEIIDRLGKVPLYELAGNGIGVYNVNQRLVSLLGEQSALEINNKEEGGTRISFRIPNIVQHSKERGTKHED